MKTYLELEPQQKLIHDRLTEVFYGHEWSLKDFKVAISCLNNRLKNAKNKRTFNKTN